MLKLVFFVPEANCEQVKIALFKCGAGQDQAYADSCWQVLGQMQYVPLAASDPVKGSIGQKVLSKEYRVEMICQEDLIKNIINTLHEVHPYNKPAYEIYRLDNEKFLKIEE